MTAGLEMHRLDNGRYVLVDVSPDGRFAADVEIWAAAQGLNAAAFQKSKDAAPTK